MRQNLRRSVAILIAAAVVSACSSLSPPPPAAEIGVRSEKTLADLPGWSLEDHVSALAAFRAACPSVQSPELKRVCSEASALGLTGEAQSRAFLERSLRPEMVREEGLLTAYYAPQYEGRPNPEGEFTAPVRPRPKDLSVSAHSAYADRETIEARAAPDALAWMRPEDLFFLQIQGSGVLSLPGGVRVMATSDGTNGARFVGLASAMREAGILSDGATSGETIHSWLASHRGQQASSVMKLNPRYVFFRILPDSGVDPTGAAGIRLIPGRSVAVDRNYHAFGDLMWIDADSPVLAGGKKNYRRLVVALDIGGAIKGNVRADLYLGRGPAAGLEAGRVRHDLRIYRLIPVDR